MQHTTRGNYSHNLISSDLHLCYDVLLDANPYIPHKYLACGSYHGYLSFYMGASQTSLNLFSTPYTYSAKSPSNRLISLPAIPAIPAHASRHNSKQFAALLHRFAISVYYFSPHMSTSQRIHNMHCTISLYPYIHPIPSNPTRICKSYREIRISILDIRLT